MGYLLEYDETNPISIETYGKRLIGKTFQDICDEMICEKQQLSERQKTMK